jgi:hypothetical protein
MLIFGQLRWLTVRFDRSRFIGNVGLRHDFFQLITLNIYLWTKNNMVSWKIPNHFIVLFCFLFSLSSIVTVATAGDGFDKQEVIKASTILKPELLRSKYHTVVETVLCDGFFYHYTVQSAFGQFKAASTVALSILINEIHAIAAMKKVDTSNAAIESLQKSGANTVAGIQHLIVDPMDTLEGAQEGISSLFNRASATVGKRKLTAAEDSQMEQLIGLTKSKGQIATKYRVNIYSKNTVLQGELDRLAKADYFGGLSIGLATSAIPGVGGLIVSTSGAAQLLNETINTTSAAELWRKNKNKLLAMSMDPDTIELFLNNPIFTPALETIVVTALEKMPNVANRELFLKVGLQASTFEMAKMITEMAVMAAGYNKHIAALKNFTPLARLLKAEKQDGGVVILLPTDHKQWSPRVASIAGDIMEQGMNRNRIGYEIWTLGTCNNHARSALIAMGWQLHEQIGKKLLPE